MIRHFCDVCYKEIEDPKTAYDIDVSGVRTNHLSYATHYWEVCPECAKAVYDVLQTRKASKEQ